MRPPYDGVSTISVTGPSLTRLTRISAPNSPVCTDTPRDFTASINAWYSGWAMAGGAAPVNDGRRPLRASP